MVVFCEGIGEPPHAATRWRKPKNGVWSQLALPECRGTPRKGRRRGLQRQPMGSGCGGQSQVHRSGGLHPDLSGDRRGHGWPPSLVQHAHQSWTDIGDGLIHLGDGQSGFIAKLQASGIVRVGMFAVMGLGDGYILWHRRERRLTTVVRFVQKACIGHTCAQRKQPHRQDHPGGMAQQVAIQVHISQMNRGNDPRLTLDAGAALTQIKKAGQGTIPSRNSVRLGSTSVGSSPNRPARCHGGDGMSPQ